MLKHFVKYCLFFLVIALPSIKSKLTAQTMVTEKVVLTTDRDLYLSGEKILFTAKVFVEGGSNETSLSKILYIELFKENKAFVQTKFRLENNLVQGSIRLPEELLSGNYYLRAYTMLM